jgi:hypothetical protein
MSSYPTNAEDQTTPADFADLLKCIKPLAEKYEVNLKKRDVDIGFNLFELISDHYYRETFHSDILNALLNPEGKHGEKDKFLQLFLNYLRSQYGATIDPSLYSDAKVAKEEGRIDVLIKGCEHAIIIENKVNDASDMEKQLPRYLKKVTDKHYICDAIIYLRLNGDAGPDMKSWDDDQHLKDEVLKKLIVICAHDGSEDGTEKDLLKGWILKCENISKENSDAHHVLRQYGKIIEKLGRKNMSNLTMKEFYKTIIDGEHLKTALTLKVMVDGLILYRAERIFDKFKTDQTPFTKIAVAGNNDTYFEGCIWNGANFGLDIGVEPESYFFQFWDKEDRPGANGKAKAMLNKMGCLNNYDPLPPPNEGVFCKSFIFPSEEESLITHIMDFKKNLSAHFQAIESRSSLIS